MQYLWDILMGSTIKVLPGGTLVFLQNLEWLTQRSIQYLTLALRRCICFNFWKSVCATCTVRLGAWTAFCTRRSDQITPNYIELLLYSVPRTEYNAPHPP